MCLVLQRILVCLCLYVVLLSTAQANSVQHLMTAYREGHSAYERESFGEAAISFERAVKLAPQVYGRGLRGAVAVDTAQLMKLLADCYQETYRLNEAMGLYDQAFAALANETGPTSQASLLCQDSMAALYRKRSQWDEAENLYQVVLKGMDEPVQRATTAKKLGRLYLNQDRFDEAEQYFRIALKFFETRTDRNSQLEASSSRHGLGMVAHRRGRMNEAESLLNNALRERLRFLPRSDRKIAQSQGMLAAVYSATDRDHLARPLLEQNVQTVKAHWRTAEHLEVAIEQHELALLLARTNEIAESTQLMDQSRRVYRDYVAGALAGLPQQEQLRFLETESGRLMDAIAMAAKYPGNQSMQQKSFEWALNVKGASQEVLAQRELLAREAATDSPLATAAKELENVRQSLAGLAISADTDSQRDILQRLTQQEAALAKRLASAGALNQSSSRWIDEANIRESLPVDACFVQILRLNRSEPSVSAYEKFDPGKAKPIYVAWIVSRNAEVRFVHLGSAAAIDAAVRSVQEQLSGDNAVKNIQFDPADAIKQVNSKLRDVSQQVLWPLLPFLDQSTHWMISPDSQLWLIPWAALIMPDGKYVVESVNVCNLVSGRDLLARSHSLSSSKYGYVLADPDFDLAPEKMVEGSLSQVDRINHDRFSTRSAQSFLASVPRDWQRLPGTDREAQAIGTPISSLIGGEVYLLKQQDALESHVKRSLPRPKVVVLATHGFFRKPAETKLANPMLCCGLVLSGANKRPTIAQNGDDGILTGLEVLRMDLRGTELVSLSACDTGLGHVTNGEGISGLRQAFHLAGAKRVLATLWEASDHYTPTLMKSFWDSMNSRVGATRSLRKAQLDLIRQLRSEGEEPHPWFWAPITLTSVGNPILPEPYR